MPFSEEQMREIDERIPELGQQAGRKAFAKARALGQSVTVRLDGDLVEIQPNGQRKVLKKLPPKVAVERGKRIKLK